MLHRANNAPRPISRKVAPPGLERADPVVPTEGIESRILLVRGRKVLLDADLAVLYGVQTRRLNEQVRRNLAMFPADFMFQLTDAEFELLMSQFATSNPGRGG